MLPAGSPISITHLMYMYNSFDLVDKLSFSLRWVNKYGVTATT
jgi:hypothetical protein